MGIYSEASVEITCDNNKVAKEVEKTIKEKIEKDITDFNYDYSELSVADEMVYLTKSSGRKQNLDYQMEELWRLIKDIKGVQELTAPVMIEDDSYYFSNPTECDNVDCKGNPINIKEVTMKKEFEGGEVNWCEACRERDSDFIANYCSICNKPQDDDGRCDCTNKDAN